MLETKIEKLTAAVNQLTRAMELFSQPAIKIDAITEEDLKGLDVTPGEVLDTAPETEPPEAVAPAKPRRRRRTKAQIEADKAAEEAAKTEVANVAQGAAVPAEEVRAPLDAARAETEAMEMLEEKPAEKAPELEFENAPKRELSYNDDIRPRIERFAAAQPGNERRAAMLALFATVNMPNGTELARHPEVFGDFVAALEEAGY